MDDPAGTRSARPAALLAGFATLYLVWGSTYLGIKLAVETLPPFLMASARFLLAGLVLYIVARARGTPAPTWRQWGWAVLTGALLLLGGNGLVTWGQQTVPSGRAALIVATTPLWMVVLGWLFYRGERPRLRVWLGLAVGFAGAALLIKPPAEGAPAGSMLGSLALALAPVCWALGSLHTKATRPVDDTLLISAVQMLAGGALMLGTGSLLGEWPVLLTRPVSTTSVAAFAYLTVVGGLVGFSTYAWLLRHASPPAVSTYAYVNPLVAVLLGWLAVGESVDARVLAAAVLVVGAVVLITWPRRQVRPPAETPDERPSKQVRVRRPERPVGAICARHAPDS
jgi:drug/metabolite transporter (DMT)-like permease